ncbi:MAG: hypothetical protein LBL39_04890, partial [Planctomycetaceae bacterium]|nr:hypothetical protein [Planctomycetaceae bacterium]
MPRIVNFVIIAIAVAFLLTQSLRSNTTVIVQDNISATAPDSTKPNETTESNTESTNKVVESESASEKLSEADAKKTEPAT